jgi:DNA mismatch endonuclease (patch repair protein)
MADVLTAEQRRLCMSRIRGRDTTPEIRVRSLIHRMGFRFRRHAQDLPGKPDIVLRSRRVVIFVHGCFWHMHACRFGRVRPATNAEFWADKRVRTMRRDRKTFRSLKRDGWRPIIVWECELRAPDRLALRLRRLLEGEKGVGSRYP